MCGIDVSTYHLDFVFIDDEIPPIWARHKLEGSDAWERCRSVTFPSHWLEDTYAIGMEVAHGPSSGAINRVVGAVLSRLPTSTLVKPWTASEWKKAVGLRGNASKQDIRWFTHKLANDLLWLAESRVPQDACDAYCIALATKQALEREANQ